MHPLPVALAALAFSALAPSAASAQGLASMTLATELGTLLGSERACGLTYDLDAIDRFIDTQVDPSEMNFPALLGTMAQGQEMNVGQMTEATRRAHCRAVAQTARHHGFIE